MRGNLVLVPVGDIHYLLAEDKYVVVHHAKGEVLIEEALKTLENEFDERFVRIHRNCLVARDRLAGLLRGVRWVDLARKSKAPTRRWKSAGAICRRCASWCARL